MRQSPVSRLAGRFALVVVLLGIASTAAGPPGVAAGDPAPFPMDVVVLTCDEDPGPVGQADVPDGCVGTDGAEVTITDAGDNEIGSCTTTDGFCVANTDLSGGGNVTATLASSAIPNGYEAIENPIGLEIVNEFSGPIFVLIPEETTGLPNTGSGPIGHESAPWALLALTALSLLLGVAGLAMRPLASNQPHEPGSSS